MQRSIGWLGIVASKFHDWGMRDGLANEHNALVPRDWWLEPWEKAAILEFHAGHPLEGYLRLAFMMLDAEVVAVSPSSVYRVLREAGLIKAHPGKPSKEGQGFEQPLVVRQHRQVDVSYLNVAGTFFYLGSVEPGRHPMTGHGVRGALERNPHCTLQSDTSRPRSSSPVATRRSSSNETASWKRHAYGGRPPVQRTGRRVEHHRAVAWAARWP